MIVWVSAENPECCFFSLPCTRQAFQNETQTGYAEMIPLTKLKGKYEALTTAVYVSLNVKVPSVRLVACTAMWMMNQRRGGNR